MTRPGIVAALLGVALGAYPVASPAQSGESSSEIERREESIFGGSGEESEPSTEESSESSGSGESSESAGREAEMFGGESESPGEEASGDRDRDLEDRFEERLETESDPLQVGGLYFGRLDSSFPEEGDPEEFPVSMPNIADLYLDARPTRRLRFYTEGRLFYDPTVDPDAADAFGGSARRLDIDLDQLWLKFDVARSVYVTVGRQHLRWGVGRFWHPNDFLFVQKRDPLAIFDERTGVDLVKFHVPFEQLGWNLYTVAQVDGADTWERFGGGARMEFLVDQTEIGVAGTYRERAPLQLGVDLSTGLWLFDLRAAGSLRHGDPATYYEGSFEPESLASPDPRDWVLPQPYSREDEWLVQALAGAEIGLRVFAEDTLYLGGEYFYNQPGYDDEDLYPWLLLQGRFRPFYVGRHYGALYASLPSPGTWDDTSFTVSTLANLSDQSFLSRIDYRLTMLTRLQFYVYSALQYGRRGEFNLRVEIPPIEAPGTPAELSDGLVVPATRARLGLGFQLAF